MQNGNGVIRVDLGSDPNIYTKVIKDNYIPKYLRDIKLVTGREESYKYIPIVINTKCADLNTYLDKLKVLIKKELDIDYDYDTLDTILNNKDLIEIDNVLYIRDTLYTFYTRFGKDTYKLLSSISMSMDISNRCYIEYYISTYEEIEYILTHKEVKKEEISIFLNNRYLINELEIPKDFKERLLSIRDTSPDSYTDYKWYNDTFKYMIFGGDKLDTLSNKEISDTLVNKWSFAGINRLFKLLGYNKTNLELTKIAIYNLIYSGALGYRIKTALGRIAMSKEQIEQEIKYLNEKINNLYIEISKIEEAVEDVNFNKCTIETDVLEWFVEDTYFDKPA